MTSLKLNINKRLTIFISLERSRWFQRPVRKCFSYLHTRAVRIFLLFLYPYFMYGSHFHFACVNICRYRDSTFADMTNVHVYMRNSRVLFHSPFVFTFLSHWRDRLTFIYCEYICICSTCFYIRGCPTIVSLAASLWVGENSSKFRNVCISVYLYISMFVWECCRDRHLCGNNSSGNTLLRASSSW